MSRTAISVGRLELVWRTQNVLHRIQSEFSRKERPSIYDAASNWYEAWYFALRLDEEIIRSRRYSHAMALVALTFAELGPRISPRRVELKSALAQVIQTKLRQTDIPG